jgi:hypothetical protein
LSAVEIHPEGIMGYNDYDERGRMYQEDDDNHPGMYDDIDLDFAVPGSNSALRATRNQGGRSSDLLDTFVMPVLQRESGAATVEGSIRA